MAKQTLKETLIRSVSDVKKAPMKIFKESTESEQGVYILNRNDVAGVMLNQSLYENLLADNDELEEKVLDLEAALRVAKIDQQKNPVMYSDKEVRGDVADLENLVDENDGWE